MSMVNCPECGAETDKCTEKCPKCGNVLSKNIAINLETTDTQENKIENVDLTTKKRSSKKIIVVCIVAAVLIISGIIAGFIIKTVRENEEKETYYSNMRSASTFMSIGMIYAEDACDLIKSVWYNTIYKKYDSETDKYTLKGYRFNNDFNDSLAALFSDESFVELINNIVEGKDIVDGFMKSIHNPPEEYIEEYNIILDFYDAYLELINLAINPKGSLPTFSSNYNSAVSNAYKYYEKANLYFNY